MTHRAAEVGVALESNVKEAEMHGRRVLMGAASLLLGGATMVGLSSAAWATGNPTITVSDPNGSAPFIQGHNFTHNGLVKVKEWEVGMTAPLHVFKWSADSQGNLAHFAFCEGNNPLQFKATDLATGKSTAKTAPLAYPCSQ
jgi:hypothetical protein